MIRGLLSCLCVILATSLAGAATFTFEWVESPRTDGVNIYWSTTQGVYGAPDVFDVSSPVCADDGSGTVKCTYTDTLPDGQDRYWFIARPYNAAGEAADSNEVWADLTVPPPIGGFKVTLN